MELTPQQLIKALSRYYPSVNLQGVRIENLEGAVMPGARIVLVGQLLSPFEDDAEEGLPS